jgi:YggT family protein
MNAAQEASLLLINSLFGLLVYAGIVRFWMQCVRAPFKNQLGQVICLMSDWGIKPLRRVVPGYGGLDWAGAVFVAILIAVWLLVQVLVMRGALPDPAVFALGWVFECARASIRCIEWVVIAYALLSMLAPGHPINTPLFTLANPLLSPFRRLIPPLGGVLDLSPMLVILCCELVLIGLRHLG